jgi:mannose/fructose/N-acetylgalactosamine-specific phosphotransferase system component IIC
MEPWLRVSLGAFIPLALAFVLPRALQTALFVAGGLLVLCGIVMLVRQEWGKSRDDRA